MFINVLWIYLLLFMIVNLPRLPNPITPVYPFLFRKAYASPQLSFNFLTEIHFSSHPVFSGEKLHKAITVLVLGKILSQPKYDLFNPSMYIYFCYVPWLMNDTCIYVRILNIKQVHKSNVTISLSVWVLSGLSYIPWCTINSHISILLHSLFIM